MLLFGNRGIRSTAVRALLALTVLCVALSLAAWEAHQQEPQAPQGLSLCDELPTGELTDEQLRQAVPDDSPGRVFIRWKTETQEDNYGFNIYRTESLEQKYTKINQTIIPGEGSTNIPKDYCFMDKPLPRGKVFYYYIESISNSGVAEILEGTKDTRVKVKTVEEEREWVRKKALGADARTTATATATTPTASAARPKAAPKPAFVLSSDSATRSSAASTTSPLD